MRKHYLTDALVTLLPALIAGGIGYGATITLGRISLLVSGASGITYTLAHLALPFAILVVCVWVINYTDID